VTGDRFPDDEAAAVAPVVQAGLAALGGGVAG
jgi:hypothetical protein